MTTITAEPPASLIERLFEQASAATSPAFAKVTHEERNRLMHSKTEYLEFYSQLKDLWLPVSRETGKLLYTLARSSAAKTIVEFGTSFGLSTLYLAAALRDNGAGSIITTEFEPSKIVLAREHFIEGGVSDLIQIRGGDALQTLASDMPDTIDLLVLDGAKALYDDILGLLESRLKPGSLIVADDADHNPDYLAYLRSPENGYLSVPFGDDVEVSIRLG